VWALALIALAAALLGAVGTGVFKAYTESRDRKAQSQTHALYDLQEAADKYRKVLIDIGADHEFLTAPQQKAYDKADSRLGIIVDRVECQTVRDHCEAWRKRADWAWRDVEEVTPAMELDAWNALRADIRQELRRHDA